MNKKIMTAVMAAMMTMGTMGSTFAAGLGTIDISALLQSHPKFQQTVTTWQKDVQKAQKDFQNEVKKKWWNHSRNTESQSLTWSNFII